MVDHDVLRADSGKAIPTIVSYSFRKARRERREQQVRPVVRDQLANIGKSRHTVEYDDILGMGAGLPDYEVAQTPRGAGRKGQANDPTPPPPFQRRFKHHDEVLCLLLDFDVAVA